MTTAVAAVLVGVMFGLGSVIEQSFKASMTSIQREGDGLGSLPNVQEGNDQGEPPLPTTEQGSGQSSPPPSTPTEESSEKTSKPKKKNKKK